MKEDVIRDISKEQETASREKFLELREELKTLSSLSFNEQSLFSQNGADQSFKLFKDAGSSAPLIKQPAAPNYINPLEQSDNEIDESIVMQCMQALQEMLGQTGATETDLQTSFLCSRQ